MDKGYHKGQELTMLGLSLEELAGQPLERLSREGARLLLTVAMEEEMTDGDGARLLHRTNFNQCLAFQGFTPYGPEFN